MNINYIIFIYFFVFVKMKTDMNIIIFLTFDLLVLTLKEESSASVLISNVACIGLNLDIIPYSEIS